MKWFDKWFADKCKAAWNSKSGNQEKYADIATLSSNSISVKRPTGPDANASMQFRVWNAVGGKVVEFNRYDSRLDRSDTTTYIIGADQDFGERIAKIVTMENLKS